MRIHQLDIRNFRSIRELTWRPRPGFNCLIGQGDVGKTTVVDAISVALAHRWNIAFCDADFYGGVPTTSIEIEVTLTDLGADAMAVDAFGSSLRGVDGGGSILDEPIDGTTAAITVRLTVDSDLEPRWELVRGSHHEPERISALRRQHFLVHRLDEGAHEHLSWSRTSALSRGTASTSELPGILANAQREARSAIFRDPDDSLQEAAKDVAARASRSAAAIIDQPRPGLDPALLLRSGSLVLHDGELPISSRGLGSRRLTSLAIQQWATADAGVVLADEIESGLEPHRIRHLLSTLRGLDDGGAPQVICTSHSPIVIEELSVTELAVVRPADEGATRVRAIEPAHADADAHQGLARSSSSAFLGSMVIVAEGATEVGVLRTLASHFDKEEGAIPAALRGVAIVDGKGSNALGRAEAFLTLGYPTALVLDGDVLEAGDLSGFTNAGGSVVQVSKGRCLEDEVAAWLPSDSLQAMVNLAAQRSSSEDPEQSIRDSISSRLPGTPKLEGFEVMAWIEQVGDEHLRVALGAAAAKKEWFKNTTGGEHLGDIILASSGAISDTALGIWMTEIKKLTHPEPASLP